jgi:hypothetical protein
VTRTDAARPSVDSRTRLTSTPGPETPAGFWRNAWPEALAHHGERASADAALLDLPPLSISVDGDAWTLRRGERTLDIERGRDGASLEVALAGDAFADLVTERRTALGLLIAGRVEGDSAANEAFCAWDPVLRSAIDGRGVYRTGDVALRALDGAPLELGQHFRHGERAVEAGHFLAQAGFLLLEDVFTDAEMDAVDADLARAVDAARPDDGGSWWAATRAGDRYPCRILDFARQSESLSALLADPRFLAIGDLLGDGHRPGDPFGEHFAEVTAEGLLKRVDSVEGLVCLPWHKDCERGGHSMFCSGLTVGICLTPVDAAHGGLDVVAGSHRANIARAQVDRGLDLPKITLHAGRGDLTVHMSCALHRSTHPTSRERRVVYTGFALPALPGDGHREDAQPQLRRDRAAIGDPTTRARFGPEPGGRAQ